MKIPHLFTQEIISKSLKFAAFETNFVLPHQCIMSSRRCLKTYSIIFGFIISFLAFLWVAFQVYLISEINSNAHDLRMARYLDICFGFLAFFSAAALMYGAFVESKTWMSAWILGSIIVLLGRWLWYLKGKFSQVFKIVCKCVVSLF